MNTTATIPTVSIRSLLHNFSQVTQNLMGPVCITSHRKKKWILLPYKQWEKEKNSVEKQPKVFSIEELKPFFFQPGNLPDNISSNIDDIYDL